MAPPARGLREASRRARSLRRLRSKGIVLFRLRAGQQESPCRSPWRVRDIDPLIQIDTRPDAQPVPEAERLHLLLQHHARETERQRRARDLSVVATERI